MLPKMDIFLFGDQTANYTSNLVEKLRQKDIPLLTSFLEKVNVALREEISQQPGLVRKTIPSFSTLLDLVQWFNESDVSSPAIESAICTTCQVACLIR